MSRAAQCFAACLCLALVAGACVRARSPDLPYSSSQKSNLTAGMVKRHVRLNETTQADVLQVFGAPNIITRDRGGREVWTYDRQSMASAAEVADWNAGGSAAAMAGGIAGDSVVGGGAVLGGSAGKGGSAGQVSSATFTLMLTFDENDIVRDYRMQATQF